MRKTISIALICCVLGGCEAYEPPIVEMMRKDRVQYDNARAQLDAAVAQLLSDVSLYAAKESDFVASLSDDQLIKYKEFLYSTDIDRTIADRALQKSLSSQQYERALNLESDKLPLLQRGQALQQQDQALAQYWANRRNFYENGIISMYQQQQAWQQQEQEQLGQRALLNSLQGIETGINNLQNRP